MNKIRGNINRLICSTLAILSLMTCVPSASAARYVLDEDDDFDLSSGGTLVSLEEVGVQYENMVEGDYQFFTKRLNTVMNAQYAQGIGANIVTDTPSAEPNEIWRLKHAGIGVYFTLSPLHAPKTFLSARGYEKGLTLSGIVTDDCLWRAAKNADGSYTLHCKNGTVMDTHNCWIDQVGTEIISFESNGTDAQKYWLSCISEVSSLTPSTRVKAFSKKCAIMVDARLNKALNIQYAKANGGLAVVDTYNGESNEIFNIYARRNNLVSIHPLHAPDYALSCKNGNPVAGNQVVLQKYTDSDFNLWEVYKFDNGSYGFRNYKTKLFLDNYWGDTTDGTKIIAHSYNGSEAQQYDLKDASAPAPTPDIGYANYTGVNYRTQTSNSRRIAACDKAVRMATVLWRNPCNFPTWKAKSGGYNSVTATDGSVSASSFVAGKTYQGIPYSMAGRTYDDVRWKQLMESGPSANSMKGRYYTSKADTTAKGIDCSYLVCTALNAGCGTSINLTTASMLTSSKFKKISLNQMQPGDVFLKSGHVMFFMGKTGNGRYAVIEANASYSRVVYRELTTSSISGYGSYRYTGF